MTSEKIKNGKKVQEKKRYYMVSQYKCKEFNEFIKKSKEEAYMYLPIKILECI